MPKSTSDLLRKYCKSNYKAFTSNPSPNVKYHACSRAHCSDRRIHHGNLGCVCEACFSNAFSGSGGVGTFWNHCYRRLSWSAWYHTQLSHVDDCLLLSLLNCFSVHASCTGSLSSSASLFCILQSDSMLSLCFTQSFARATC